MYLLSQVPRDILDQIKPTLKKANTTEPSTSTGTSTGTTPHRHSSHVNRIHSSGGSKGRPGNGGIV